MDDAWLGVRIRDDDLALEPVRVDEEHRQDRTEVGDEIIGGAAGHEAAPDLFERLERGCLKSHVVEAPSTEHGRLTVGLVVAFDLEDVQFAPVADVDERELEAGLLLDRPRWRRVEVVCVEPRQAISVMGEDCHVVDAVEQHGPSVGQSGRRAPWTQVQPETVP